MVVNNKTNLTTNDFVQQLKYESGSRSGNNRIKVKRYEI